MSVALLFLTRKDFNFSSLWKKALLASPPNKPFNVYVHSKEPMEDAFFAKHRIDNIVPTTWAIHAKAWQALLQEALKNDDNKYFVFLSEACMPIRPLEQIYDAITGSRKSRMCYRKRWWNKEERTLVELGEDFSQYGNHEWMILNRDHAKLVAEDVEVIDIASRHICDIESYFSALLHIHGLLNDEFVENVATTYANWDYPTNDECSPFVFEDDDEFTMQLFAEAVSSGEFFARKFAPTFPYEKLEKLICL